MAAPPLDLRLVPAAGACWAACLAGVRLAPRAALTAAAVAGFAALLLVVGRLPDRGPALRSGRTGAASLCGHAVLLAVVLAAALASAGAQRAVRDAGLLAALVAERAQVRVVGTVRSEPVPLRRTAAWGGDDAERLRVDLDVERAVGAGRAGPAAAPVLVLAGEDWRQVAYGARVEAFGRLAPTAPGDRVRAVLVVRGPPAVRAAPGVLDRHVRTVRQALLRVSDPLPPDRRGLVPGAAIGDTSRVPDDLDAAMRTAGLTHITAVSGAHFAVVGGTVLALTAAAGMPRGARVAVVGLAMAAFVVLVHPAPSVLRAAVTGAVGLAALVLGRPSRAVPALAAGVVVLLVLDPWLAGSAGFALSVAATAGIVLGSGPLARRLGPALPERAARLVAVPVAAQCAVGPLVATLAPGLPTYAVPANLLAAPAVPWATVLGVLAALLAPWWEGAGAACAEAAGWGAWWIASVARTSAALPGARLPWPAGPWGPVLLVVGPAAAVLAVARPWRRDDRPP